MKFRTYAALLAAFLPLATARANVVINEVYYNGPNELDNLQWIELYNSSGGKVDLSGWELDTGKVFSFPAGSSIEGNGYLVLALDPAQFGKVYKTSALGPFKRPLKRGGERLTLTDARGQMEDTIRYKDEAPWPVSADGYSSSLERITPGASGELPENWAASLLPKDHARPTGTPGKQNDGFSATLPPIIERVTPETDNPRPGQPLIVTAEIKGDETPVGVRLQYRLVSKGIEGNTLEIPMERDDDGFYHGAIPAQANGALVRYRVRAKAVSGAVRFYPAENELRPMLAAYFHDKWTMAGVPFGILLGSPKQPKVKQAFFLPTPRDHTPPKPEPKGQGGRRRNFHGPGDFLAFMMLQSAGADTVGKMSRASFTTVVGKWSTKWDANKDRTLTLREMEKGFNVLVGYVEEDEQEGGGQRNFSPGKWLSTPVMKALGGKGNQISVSQFNARFATLGVKWDANKNGGLDNAELETGWTKLLPPPDFGGRRRRGGPGRRGDENASGSEDPGATSRAPRGASTFIYVDPASGNASVYDYVTATSRDREDQYRGYKVNFYKDQPLLGMTTANLCFEGRELSLLAEQMAYDVYHRLNEPAPLSEFMRLWVDGKMVGYHLIIERPNRGFLRRNQIDDKGTLYKLIWYGGDIVGQHEKKTHARLGHEDLLTLVDQLKKTQGDEQWKVIQDNFDVNEVATYFAVNMILSHWDGFFNNYYTYHDSDDTKKWQMYPWDQDQTWGIAGSDEEVFFNMPLNFGMNGALPPGSKSKAPRPGDDAMGDDGPFWWRPPGFFSGPLLANPQFRQIYLARIKEILDNVYTQEIYDPLIDELADRLKADTRLEAQESGQPVEGGIKETEFYANHLKQHLAKRREFLLKKLAATEPKTTVSKAQRPR